MHSETKSLSSICQKLVSRVRERASKEGVTGDEVVHAIRVATKRLRAAWKLVVPHVGRKFAAERAAALRNLSGMLSHHRDLAVLIDLGESLGLRYPEADFESLTASLEEAGNQSSVEPDGENLEDRVHSLLEEEAGAWAEVRFASFGEEQKVLRRVIRRTLAKARRKTGLALGSSDPHIWHEWRKNVKRLRYQREFLAGIQGRLPGKWDSRISRLGTRLGQRNDLANLAHEVESRGNEPALRKAIAREERHVIGNCRRLGRRNLSR